MGPIRFFSILLLYILSFSPTLLFSQTTSENEYGSWFVLSGTNIIGEKWSIPTVGILRHHGMWENYEFAFVRTGINYHASQKVQLGLGGAFLDSKHYLPGEDIEIGRQFWFYQQLRMKSKWYRYSLDHRLRLENRWIHREQDVYFNARVRYRIQFIKPLVQRIYVRSFNELFVNLNENLFNQNRLYIGIGFKASKNLNIDFGYLKNHFNSHQNDVIRMGVQFKTNMASGKKNFAKKGSSKIRA